MISRSGNRRALPTSSRGISGCRWSGPKTRSDYLIETAEGIDHEPTWPEKDFDELLKLAFDGKVIDSEEHPYVRRLRGLLD